jgi:hypothetical protein
MCHTLICNIQNYTKRLCSDGHEPGFNVVTHFSSYPDKHKRFTFLPFTANHCQSGPSFTLLHHWNLLSLEGRILQFAAGLCQHWALVPCHFLNITKFSSPKMSESARSDLLHHPGDDLDNEGSVAFSHASEMMNDISLKRTRKTSQNLGIDSESQIKAMQTTLSLN